MRKIIGLVMIVVWLCSMPLLEAKTKKNNDSAKGKNKKSSVKVEKAEVIELQPLLKGMTFVRIRCLFNDIAYYQGYRNPRDTKKEDFNLDKVEKKLKENSIPLTKVQVQELYSRLETELKANGVRILDIQTAEESDSTVIPTITLGFDCLTSPPDRFFLSVDLTATKWMSYWAGEESVQSPVIVWWQKKLAETNSNDFISVLDKTASTLLEKFTTQLTYANAKTAEEVKATTTPQKDTKKDKKSEKKKAEKPSKTSR